MAYTLKSSSASIVMKIRAVIRPSLSRTNKNPITTLPLRRRSVRERWIVSRLWSKKKVERKYVSQRSLIVIVALKWNDRYALLYFRIESLRKYDRS